jgi:flagellin
MLSGISLNTTVFRITQFNKINSQHYSSSIRKLASGKRFQNPSDNISDYFRTENLKRNYHDYGHIKQSIGETIAMVDVAVHIGEGAYNNLLHMRDLVDQYHGTETLDEDKPGIAAEFDALKAEVNHLIENSYYDDKKLVSDSSASPLTRLHLDTSDMNQTYDITFTSDQIADVSSLTLGISDFDTEANAVQAELDKAASYLASASAYSRGLNAQNNIINNKMVNNKVFESALSDIDSAKEMATVVDRSIRHDSSIAMMAQANIFRSAVLKLVGIWN